MSTIHLGYTSKALINQYKKLIPLFPIITVQSNYQWREDQINYLVFVLCKTGTKKSLKLYGL